MLCGRVVLSSILIYYLLIYHSSCEKVKQLVLEHATVTYFSRDYFNNLTMISKRYSRKDKNIYANVYVVTKRSFTNNFSIDFTFYELLSNVYKPTFVGFHFDSFCDFIAKDQYIGPAVVAAYKRSTPAEKQLKDLNCPYPPSEYVFENITVPYTPLFNRFPFINGRIVGTVSYDKKEIVAKFYVDMSIKAL